MMVHVDAPRVRRVRSGLDQGGGEAAIGGQRGKRRDRGGEDGPAIHQEHCVTSLARASACIAAAYGCDRISSGQTRDAIAVTVGGVKNVMILAALAGAMLQPPAAPPPAVPATLAVPPGFTVSVFASGLNGARLMAVSPEGVLLVARRPRNEVVALPDHDGTAQPRVILSNLTNAHSLAFKDGWLYVATTPAIVRVRWSNGAPAGEPETVVELPSSTPSVHVSRTINFGPDGRLYVAIGSSCNVCVESDPRRTTIQVVTREGTLQPYARGLHNAIVLNVIATSRRNASDLRTRNASDTRR